MAQKEGFFSRNKDLINVAGHSINALQNTQVKSNQRVLAKLSLINKSMQEESLKNDQKRLELLDQQNQQLQEREIERKQNEHIKKVMLGAAPELEELIFTIQGDSSAEEKTKLYLEARYLLRFLKNYRQLIEDLQFQKLLHKSEKDLKSVDELDREILNELCFLKVQEETEYLKALQILIMDENEYKTLEASDICYAESILNQVYHDPTRSSILSEALIHLESDKIENNEKFLEGDFKDFVLRVNDKINNFNFFSSEIQYQIGFIKYKYIYDAVREIEDHLGEYVPENARRTVIYPNNFLDINHKMIFDYASDLKKFKDYKKIKENDEYIDQIGLIWAYKLEYYLSYIFIGLGTNIFGEKEQSIDYLYDQFGSELNCSKDEVIDKYIYFIRGAFDITFFKTGYTNELVFEQYRSLKGENCFVVTVTTGSSNNVIVNDYRSFRDSYLQKKMWGRIMIHTYYKIGPYLADFIRSKPSLKQYVLTRLILPLHKRIKRHN